MLVMQARHIFFLRGWLAMDSMDAVDHVKLDIVCAVDVIDLVVLSSSPSR